MGSTLLSAELTLAAAARGRPLGAFGNYQIVRRSDGLVIGDAGFVGPPDETGAVTLGCAIIESERRQGYASEALRALLDWAATQTGLTCVLAEATRANPAAQRLLERIGMHPLGEDDQLLYYMSCASAPARAQTNAAASSRTGMATAPSRPARPASSRTAASISSGGAVNGSRRWCSNVPSTENDGPGATTIRSRAASAASCVATGALSRTQALMPPCGGWSVHAGAWAASAASSASRRSRRSAAARGEDLVPAGEQLDGDELLEHRAGEVEVGARGRELADEPRRGAHPADPQAAPGRLAHRPDREHRAAGVVRGERRRERRAVEPQLRGGLVGHEQRRRRARRQQGAPRAAPAVITRPVGFWKSGTVIASRGVPAEIAPSHASASQPSRRERDRHGRGRARRGSPTACAA